MCLRLATIKGHSKCAGREMNIQFMGNSSGGHSCSQHANCTLPQNLQHKFILIHTQLHRDNQQWNVFSAFNPSNCTHTPGAVGGRCSSARGAVGGLVLLLKGLTSVRGQFLPEPRFEPTTSGYKSNALSIRPRLPHICDMCCVIKLHILEWPFIVASLRHTCAIITTV